MILRRTLHPCLVLQPYMVQREGYRVQRLLTLRWLQLTFPYRDAMPSHLRQLSQLLPVPFLIPPYLRHPKLPICLRDLTTLRTLNHIILLTSDIFHPWQCHMVPVPEAPIHKDASPVFPQHQIRMPRQPPVVQTIPESPLPQPPPHNHLRLRVLRPNRRHIRVPLLWRELIHTLMHKFFPCSKPRACCVGSPRKSRY